jgi:hypothetical protein
VFGDGGKVGDIRKEDGELPAYAAQRGVLPLTDKLGHKICRDIATEALQTVFMLSNESCMSWISVMIVGISSLTLKSSFSMRFMSADK